MELSSLADIGPPVMEDETPSMLYVLLSKEHRVSRSVRSSWFFQHLYEDIVIEKDDDQTNEKKSDIRVISAVQCSKLLPDTNVFYISQQYSSVFVIDMTPSMMQVSNETFAIKFDEAQSALETCLLKIAQPLQVPYQTSLIQCDICVTVLAYIGAFVPKKPVEVIVQGVHLHKDNVNELIQLVKDQLHRLENRLSQGTTYNDQYTGTPSPDTSLEGMIKVGILAVQLLPRNALKGLVLLTDGVGGFVTPTSMHNIVNQLRSINVSCWVVLCGGGTNPSIALGAVADTQVLAYLTGACNGCVLDPNKILKTSAQSLSTHKAAPINPIQHCILLWSLQQSAWKQRIEGVVYSHLSYEDPFVPQTPYNYHGSVVKAPFLRVIGCRIRDGFFIKSIMKVTDSQIEVVMMYPWQPNITIECNIRAPWPLIDSTSSLVVAISFEAPYPFVRDFQNEKDIKNFSGPHTTALKRFNNSLKSLINSDGVLIHLLSFSSNPLYYTLSQSLLDGMPLFFLPPNQSKPVLAIETGEDKSLQVLANYWKSLSSIDINIWPRWLHTYKIPLVLNQDSPLPSHLLHPSESGRYSSIQCRVAASKLFAFLRNWSTLVLLDNHSYVKLLPDETIPQHLCLVRVAQMHPCLIVHVGFLEGTPKHFQHEIISLLKETIRGLKIPLPLLQSSKQSSSRKKTSSSIFEQPCAVVINKQLQKALISYDFPLGGEVPVQWQYMSHHRWQWKVPQMHPVLLTGLLQRRLQEGFLIASAHNGIVTLVVELNVKQPSSSLALPSLVQYVLFPLSPDGILTCEVWVEPQYQTVLTTPPGLQYIIGENVLDIPYKIHSVDIEVLTALTSFLEHSYVGSTPTPLPLYLSSPLDHETTNATIFEQLVTGKLVEVQFKLSSLYSKSHVTAYTFSAFMENSPSSDPITLDNCSPLNRLLHSRFLELLQQQLASTSIPVQEPLHVMNRLIQSDKLNSFVQLCKLFQDGSRLLWRCFAYSKDESLSLIFTPCFLCPTHQSDVKGSYCLPLVLMYTNLATLLGHNNLMGVHPLPPDTYINKLFSNKDQTVDTPTILSALSDKLKSIHTVAYLHSMHTTLQQGGVPPTQYDLEQGLNICNYTDLVVNVTPLLIAICKHAKFGDQREVTTETLASFLEMLGDQRQSSSLSDVCFNGGLEFKKEECQRRESEVKEILLSFLQELGFNSIEGVGGYFWHLEPHTKLHNEKELTIIHDDRESLKSPPFTPKSRSKTLTLELDDTDSEDEMIDLEPLLSPSSETGLHVNHTPLFLRLSYTLKHNSIEDNAEQTIIKEGFLEDGRIPLCLSSLLSGVTSKDDFHCDLRLKLRFFSLLDANELADITKETSCSPTDLLINIHRCFRPTASSLKWKIEWLVRDELLSRARELVAEGEPVLSSLLQSVASHVQGSSGKFPNCIFNQEQIKFVFGAKTCMNQFLLHLQAMTITNYSIKKANNDYFYLAPSSLPTLFPRISLNSVSPLTSLQKRHSTGRCSSPSSPPPLLSPKKHTHQRSVSWSATPKSPLLGPLHSRSSVGSMTSSTGIADSNYDASGSNTSNSFAFSVPSTPSLMEDLFWLVIRVLPLRVEVYLHNRCSSNNTVNDSTLLLCNNVTKVIGEVCHRTNQWFLLKDLLDTHVCSPLLLPESHSDKWVEGIMGSQNEIIQAGERFAPQQFECQSKWRKHITPHWRLRNMKNKPALQITRNALNAFAISNCIDVYVIQDALDGGEEAIFYLKVFESICQVERGFDVPGDDHVGDNELRCETRATVEADTISVFSRSDIIEPTFTSQLSTQLSDSLFSVNSDSKAQESIVLELYGISEPSDTLKSRLQRVIQLKLDDAALDMMCSSYSRNQKLRLSPADVEFLQPSPDQPSQVIPLTLPNWVPNPHAMFFYLLQQLSCTFLPPQYTVFEKNDSTSLHTPPDLTEALKNVNLPSDVQQDFLFLYIRPVTRGRGMALISASLFSPEGIVLPPLPGLLPPTILCDPPTLEESTHVEVLESFPCKGEGFSIVFHIWERGNVGMSDLEAKLISCVQHSLLETFFELHCLHLPVASITEEEIERRLSPGLLRRSLPNKDLELPLGFIDVTLEPFHSSDQLDVEEAMRPSSVTIRPSNMTGDVLRPSSVMGDMTRPASVMGEERVRSSSGMGEEMMRPSSVTKEMEGQQNWEQKEKQRRIQTFRKTVIQKAYMGQLGELTNDYLVTIPACLSAMNESGSPTIFYCNWSLPANYTTDVALSHSLSSLKSILTEMTFSIFKKKVQTNIYSFFPADKLSPGTSDHTSHLYILIGRDHAQWLESQDPADPTKHLSQIWSQALLHLPLASWKESEGGMIHEEGVVPLLAVAKKHSSFVPRHQFLLGLIGHGKFELWMYNISETRVRVVKNRLNEIVEWQKTRAGFLQHLLTQKMGLFHHTAGKDVTSLAQNAVKHCSTLQNASTLINESAPTSNNLKSSHPLLKQPRVTTQVDLESFYQDQEPLSPTSPKSPDPIRRHGKQFQEMLINQREFEKQKDLLGKVFESWEKHKIDDLAPINSETISKLKRTSRLLHYCSSRLLLPDLNHNTENQISEEDEIWQSTIRENFLNSYLEYLKTLHFHLINERPPTRQGRHSLSPSHTPLTHPLHLYKCLQRSWTGGIMLIDMSFITNLFHVKLYSIERSRLSNLPPPSYEVSGLFSQECGRMKDFIHVHSFTYDFHIRMVLNIIRGRTKFHGNLNLRDLLDQFWQRYQHPPNFIRNRICRDTVTISLSVTMESFYKHIIRHCSEYDVQTLELVQSSRDGSGLSPTLWDISLMIDLAPSVIGPMTTPELSRILHDTRELYHVIILAIPIVPVEDDHTHQSFSFTLYMLLVNKNEVFPRLTVNTPFLSRHLGMSRSDEGEPESETMSQSQLHVSVRNHRRKLGYGSLNSPSSVSEVVINPSVTAEEMDGVKKHFINIVRAVQTHVRRNELWKRLLYGGGGHRVEMQALSCTEFQELLQLVTCYSFDFIDPQLLPLQKQTNKWYHTLLQAMEERFQSNFKLFQTEDNTDKYGVIINEDWQDMFILLRSDKHNSEQGFYSVYRNQQEGVIPQEQRKLTANIEADHHHIANIVNFACCHLWTRIIIDTPTIGYNGK